LIGNNADMSPPLILLTGFLGAGKTTCLQGLLADDRLAKRLPGVLVNDFGALGIDAMLLGNPDHLVSLVDGCLCCSLQDDLLLGVLALLDAGAERIYVEPSGLADPVGILEALAVPDLAQRLSTIVCLTVTRSGSPPVDDPVVIDLWQQQIRLADGVLLTHQESASAPELLQHLDNLRQVGGTGSLVLTSFGKGFPPLLDVWLSEPPPEREAVIGRVQNLGWHASVIHPDPALTSTAFDAWLTSLPETVYRVKGFVWLADTESWWLVQGVGEDRRRYRWSGDPGESGGIVMIGAGKLEV